MRRARFALLSALVAALGLPFFACDDGDSPAPACRIQVVSPGGGEIWFADSTYTILWTDEGACASLVAIELLREGEVCLTLADTTANDGEFAWTARGCAEDTTSARVGIRALSGGGRGESGAEFLIVPAPEPQPCRIRVTRPDGGETWSEGGRYDLTWDRRGDCGATVRLELLREGEVCRTVAAATANDGSHPWTAARCGAQTEGYALRVTDLDSGAADTSDAAFSIGPGCLLQLTSPAGGEVWRAGETRTITWEFAGACARSVRLELWRAGGVCDTLAEVADNNGRFVWEVAACRGGGSDYRVRVVDPGSGHFGESAGPFTVETACRPTLIVPDGSEDLCRGDKYTVRWEASAACGKDARLELLRDGVLCGLIASATANDGEFSWEVEPCGGPGGGYSVRVIDADSGAADTSAARFAILSGCVISLQQPNGGETFCAGQAVYFLWNGAHPCCGAAVRIELLRGEEVCAVVAPATANSGEYVWNAAPCDAEGGSYRVRVVDLDSGAADLSDGPVTLLPPCSLAVTAPAAGTDLCDGQTVQIAWTRSSCCGDRFKIDLVRNGEICRTIADAAPAGPGSYAWTAGRWEGHESGYQIRITDLGSWRYAETPGAFGIRSCTRGE